MPMSTNKAMKARKREKQDPNDKPDGLLGFTEGAGAAADGFMGRKAR